MKLDNLHIAILNELQLDARASNAELGRRVGLTAPAVAKRINTMKKKDIIKGFQTNINFECLNYPQKLLIGVDVYHNYKNIFLKEIEGIKGITDVVRTTGKYCYVLTLHLQKKDNLDAILNKLERLGETVTSSILSSPIENKPIKLS